MMVPDGSTPIASATNAVGVPAASVGALLAPLEAARLWIGNADVPGATGTSYTLNVCAISSTHP